MKTPKLSETERAALAATINKLAANSTDTTHASDLTAWADALVKAGTTDTVKATLQAMGYTGPKL